VGERAGEGREVTKCMNARPDPLPLPLDHHYHLLGILLKIEEEVK